MVRVSLTSPDLSKQLANRIELVVRMPPKSVREIAMEKRAAALKAQEQHDAAVKGWKPDGPPKGTVRHVFLMQDLSGLTESRLNGLKAELSFPHGMEYDNITHFQVTVKPEEGFWRGGRFSFLFDIPADYKNSPPKVHCITKHLHPNIDPQGNVCLNLLRADWLPTLSLENVLVGLLHLYVCPNADDPLDKEAADLMRSDPQEFERKTRRSCGLA